MQRLVRESIDSAEGRGDQGFGAGGGDQGFGAGGVNPNPNPPGSVQYRAVWRVRVNPNPPYRSVLDGARGVSVGLGLGLGLTLTLTHRSVLDRARG